MQGVSNKKVPIAHCISKLLVPFRGIPCTIPIISVHKIQVQLLNYKWIEYELYLYNTCLKAGKRVRKTFNFYDDFPSYK